MCLLRVFSLSVRFAICAYVGDILRRRFTIILLKSSMEVVGAGIAQSDGYFGYGQPVLAQKFGGGGHARLGAHLGKVLAVLAEKYARRLPYAQSQTP